MFIIFRPLCLLIIAYKYTYHIHLHLHIQRKKYDTSIIKYKENYEIDMKLENETNIANRYFNNLKQFSGSLKSFIFKDLLK